MSKRHFLLRTLRTTSAALVLGVSLGACANETATADSMRPVLTKGRGIPVCDDYLARLNLSVSRYPPYCGRPESNEIDGFEKLNRIPLTIDEAWTIGDRLRNFTNRGNQDLFTNHGRSFMTMDVIQRELGRTIFAWRYDPPVDLDNDGMADSVLIWQGYGASHGIYPCGSIKETEPRWQSQLAYIVDFDVMRIDENRTQEIFGHPSGKRAIIVDEKRTILPGFWPVGGQIGIFKYRSLYYFDTFLYFEPDSEKDTRIGGKLGVFLRSQGRTNEICEYQWTNF